jgi:uncharacterized membrane protein YhaH (DUF805 family)
MNWYIGVLQKYFDFSGRARRTEFWMFVLFNIIVSVVLYLIDNYVLGMPILASIYGLAVLLPFLGVSVRRLHDTGRSGWWLLIGLIPLIGAIILIIFYVQDSQPGANQYGPNPKGM